MIQKVERTVQSGSPYKRELILIHVPPPPPSLPLSRGPLPLANPPTHGAMDRLEPACLPGVSCLLDVELPSSLILESWGKPDVQTRNNGIYKKKI